MNILQAWSNSQMSLSNSSHMWKFNPLVKKANYIWTQVIDMWKFKKITWYILIHMWKKCQSHHIWHFLYFDMLEVFVCSDENIKFTLESIIPHVKNAKKANFSGIKIFFRQ